MMDENNIVKSLWIGPFIDDMLVLCIKSFLAAGIEFQMYAYNEIENLPEDVVVKDANEILDYSFVFKDNVNSYATFSDWFRIKLLYEIGGWWVDSDVLLIKKFDTENSYVFATESFSLKESLEIRVCNAVMKMPKKSKIGGNILARIEEKLNNQAISDIKWTEIGAGYLKEEIVDNCLEEFIVAPETFCPNPWNTFDQVSSRNDFNIGPETYSVHLWNNMWKWSKKNPLENLTDGSLLFNAKNTLGEKGL